MLTKVIIGRHYKRKQKKWDSRLVVPFLYITSCDYSATSVKRLKATIASSLSCWASH